MRYVQSRHCKRKKTKCSSWSGVFRSKIRCGQQSSSLQFQHSRTSEFPLKGKGKSFLRLSMLRLKPCMCDFLLKKILKSDWFAHSKSSLLSQSSNPSFFCDGEGDADGGFAGVLLFGLTFVAGEAPMLLLSLLPTPWYLFVFGRLPSCGGSKTLLHRPNRRHLRRPLLPTHRSSTAQPCARFL